jgi:hypothetical protein
MRQVKVACNSTIRMLNPDQVEMVGDGVSIQEFHFRVHDLPASACDNRSAGWHDKI